MSGSLSRGYRRLRSAAARRAVVVAPWLLALRRGNGGSRESFDAASLDAFATGSRSGFSAPADELSLDALRTGRYIHPRFVDGSGYAYPPEGTVFTSVCNDKYAPGLEALLLSLLSVYPDLDARYVVYHDGGLSPLSQDRLSGIYPRVEFVEGSASQYTVTLGDHYNHRKVGLLGYLTLDALSFDAPWVIILDTDLLVLGDISALWSGTAPKAVPDIGHRPFGVVSAVTGKPVINSGVLALPASELGAEAVERARAVLQTLDSNTDPDIAMFADQKFWNVYLATRPLDLLPQNYNSIKTLVTHHYPAELGAVRILHLTAAKPWYDVVNDVFLSAEDRLRFRHAEVEFSAAFALWNQVYRKGIAASRIDRFTREQSASLAASAGSAAGRRGILLAGGKAAGGGTSPADAAAVTIGDAATALAPTYRQVAPDHLVLTDPELFGGWHSPRPEIRADLLAALTSAPHKPHLWLPFAVKPYMESSTAGAALASAHRIDYVLVERPMLRPLEKYGELELDLARPLASGATALVTTGVAVATHLGVEELSVVGPVDPYPLAVLRAALDSRGIPLA